MHIYFHTNPMRDAFPILSAIYPPIYRPMIYPHITH